MATAESTRRNIDKQRRGADGKVLGSTPTKKIVEALDECYKAIRANHPEVPGVVLVVGASSRRAHGHFHAMTWAKNDGKGDVAGYEDHEIMLSGQTLARSAEDVFGTLLHEAAHALAQVRGVQDTSRQGRFHNTRFKALAEEVGMVVEKIPGIGWSGTSIPDETKRKYRAEITMLRRTLKTHRIPEWEREKAPRKKTTVKLQTASGRTVTVPITFHEAGPIFDGATGELFEKVED
jgi:hypothetical protein